MSWRPMAAFSSGDPIQNPYLAATAKSSCTTSGVGGAGRRFGSNGLAVRRLRENKIKLEQAFVYEKAIDAETYKEMRATLTEELTLAEMEFAMPRRKKSK